MTNFAGRFVPELAYQGRTVDPEPIIEQSHQNLQAAHHWSAPLVDIHRGRLRMAQDRLIEAEADELLNGFDVVATLPL